MEGRKQWFIKAMKNRPGLALGGGGARGCYEIGAWKALEELNLHFDCVAGTSIGALVGVMYVQGSLQQMEDFVRTLVPSDIAKDLFDMPEHLSGLIENHKEIGSFLNQYIFSREGMNISPLKDVLHRMFRYSIFMQSPIDYACMTYNLSTHRGEAYFKQQMNEQDAESIILASASCYPAFPVLKMNGQEYIDGGYSDNVPVDLALKMGADAVLAIDVQGPGITRPLDPSWNVLLVKPMLSLGSFLDFSTANGMKAMQAGELETRKLAGAACGLFFTFDLASQSDRQFWMGSIDVLFTVENIVLSEAELKKIVLWTTGCSQSDLFDALFESGQDGQLIECLAFLAGVDPYRLWSWNEFLAALMKKLEGLEEKRTDLATFWRAARAHELDRLKAICIFESVLEQAGTDSAKKTYGAFGALYPAEAALAWTWYFLKGLTGLNE